MRSSTLSPGVWIQTLSDVNYLVRPVTLIVAEQDPMILIKRRKVVNLHRPRTKQYSLLITLSPLLLSAAVVPSVFGQSCEPTSHTPPADANEAQSTQSSSEDTFGTRSTLTGDWNGVRSSMAHKGVTLDVRFTSFYQGLASGTGDEDFGFGDKFDSFINFDSSKMGLWEAAFARISSTAMVTWQPTSVARSLQPIPHCTGLLTRRKNWWQGISGIRHTIAAVCTY